MYALLLKLIVAYQDLKVRVEARESWPSIEHVERLIEGRTAHLEARLQLKQAEEKDREKLLLSALAQTVEKMISTKLSEVVPEEIRCSVLPGNSTFTLFVRTSSLKSYPMIFLSLPK